MFFTQLGLMKKIFCLLSFLLYTQVAHAVDAVEYMKKGPVHEAFVTQEYGDLILQAVPQQPPKDLNEQIPDKRYGKAQWINGYWKWSTEHDDYIWISGVWRLAPPGQHWISGKWTKLEEGWVWLKGFWSPVLESDLEHISEPPPDHLDDVVPNAPSEGYFWVPGYWFFDEGKSDYVWYRGRWQAFNEDWQYVPAHYMWREEGYIFIPGYWDWPIEKRGQAFANAYIEPDRRSSIVYEPSVALEPLEIVENLYACWPSYPCFFHHHYFYHFDIWMAWGIVPPWWHWDSWWAFGWSDSWWLWWWWVNPGFPAPFFLDVEIAGMMFGPAAFLLEMLGDVLPPPIVVEDGVMGPQALIEAIEEVTGHESPVLPSNPSMVEEIQEEAYPKGPEQPTFRPSGRGVTKQPPPKPHFGPSANGLSSPPERAVVPPLPQVRKPKRPPVQVVRPKRPPTYRNPPPTYQPEPPKTYPDVTRPQRQRYPSAPPERYAPPPTRSYTPPPPRTYKPQPPQTYKPQPPQSYKPQQPTPQSKPSTTTRPQSRPSWQYQPQPKTQRKPSTTTQPQTRPSWQYQPQPKTQRKPKAYQGTNRSNSLY